MQRIKMPQRKPIHMLMESVLFVVLVAVLGQISVNFWERYAIKSELIRMKGSLQSLKDTINNIGLAYDQLHIELKTIAKIADDPILKMEDNIKSRSPYQRQFMNQKLYLGEYQNKKAPVPTIINYRASSKHQIPMKIGYNQMSKNIFNNKYSQKPSVNSTHDENNDYKANYVMRNASANVIEKKRTVQTQKYKPQCLEETTSTSSSNALVQNSPDNFYKARIGQDAATITRYPLKSTGADVIQAKELRHGQCQYEKLGTHHSSHSNKQHYYNDENCPNNYCGRS